MTGGKKIAAPQQRSPADFHIIVRSEEEGIKFTSPVNQEDAWEQELQRALGTSSEAAMATFVFQLSDLCRTTFDHQHGHLVPNELELNSILAFIRGVNPANEMEAALAAEMVAIHLMQMRVSKAALRDCYQVDPPSTLLASKLAKTFAAQCEALSKLQSRGVEARQIIRVEKHVHQHQHVHLDGEA